MESKTPYNCTRFYWVIDTQRSISSTFKSATKARQYCDSMNKIAVNPKEFYVERVFIRNKL